LCEKGAADIPPTVHSTVSIYRGSWRYVIYIYLEKILLKIYTFLLSWIKAIFGCTRTSKNALKQPQKTNSQLYYVLICCLMRSTNRSLAEENMRTQKVQAVTCEKIFHLCQDRYINYGAIESFQR